MHQPPEHFSDLYQTAMHAQQAGINVIPMCTDGSKRPALKNWRSYQQRRVTPGEVNQWFRARAWGLAAITGTISGNLEALDIDSAETYQVWLTRLQKSASLKPLYERIAQGYLEATPDGGRHLLYRCEAVGRNQKLARRPLAETHGYQTLIETRGTGGLLIIAPSRGQVHPSGKPYRLLHGDITEVAAITPAERSQLLTFARTFDETPEQLHETRTEYSLATRRDPLNPRPGDLFNQLASWDEILCPHGWTLAYTIDGSGQWRRPGKKGPGISATTNYRGSDRLYVFSTSTLFEAERVYTKFTAYALLEHGGDFPAAARALVEEGYVPEIISKVARSQNQRPS
jgi:hypothetical protein